MKSFQVRKKFIDFFRKNHHKILPGSSLVPDNDPSLLFVNAGMNQFKNVFLCFEKAPAKNAITIQKCLRAGGKHNDLENVGETSLHHTFFEMLGNFSFGGYFKKEAIALSWKFLTQELQLNPEDLWISVYEKDDESYKIWREDQKIPENRIYQMGEKDNFWQMGEVGPCGPCTEIHYYKGKEKRPDPNRFMEIWNLVFMEFYDTEGGRRQKLSVPCVDTGMGLERLCSVLQNKKSNYHTDLFSEIISSLEEASGLKYDFEEKSQTDRQKAFRVLADHSRAICFLINDEVIPGNEKESYVLRRIIRRALYYSRKLHPTKNLLQVGVDKTLSLMNETGSLLKKDKEMALVAEAYLFSEEERKNIQSVLESERDKFSDSLKAGGKKLEEIMKSCPEKNIPAKEVWNLYSTYGFPVDLTRLVVKEKGWNAPADEEMERHIRSEIKCTNEKTLRDYRERDEREKRILYEQQDKGLKSISERTGQQQELNSSGLKISDLIEGKKQKNSKRIGIRRPDFIRQYSDFTSEIPKTIFTGYENSTEKSQILFMGSIEMPSHAARDGNRPAFTSKPVALECLQEGKEGWLISDKTCFYPEGGGPIGDRGLLKTETGQAEVLDCQKKDNIIWHRAKVLEGHLEKEQKCQMEVSESFRKNIKASHTATHLLNAALRNVLGGLVRQAGSLVEPGCLRFDFTHSKALTEKEIQAIEEQVWQSIEKEEDLSSSFKSLAQAKKEGALFLKGENYDSEVRVISIGEKTSKELCGGIHVQNTREIESFKIVSERGVQSGVRRIVAYTSSVAKSWESFLKKQNRGLREYLYPSGLKISVFTEEKKQKNSNRVGIKRPLVQDGPGVSLFMEREKSFWKGSLEKQNPFLSWIENKERELKNLRKQIVHLGEKDIPGTSFSQSREFVSIRSRFHPLALQTLELREHLKLPLVDSNRFTDGFPKQAQSEKVENFFQELESPLDWLKTKEQEVQKLKGQLNKIRRLAWTQAKLLQTAKKFKAGGVEGKLLVIDLPLGDRKMLSDISDVLLFKLSSGLVVLSGKAENKHPVFVNRTKNFEKILSAGDILKNIVVPLCKGKGGGKDSFAQGSITDKSAFFKLESILLGNWSQL